MSQPPNSGRLERNISVLNGASKAHYSLSPNIDRTRSVPAIKPVDRERLREVLMNDQKKTKRSIPKKPFYRDVSHLRDRRMLF